ncbi:uncharacterized protein JCM6883_007642 [Sporobolomyces salmoneus]|uniref:uncharacterized protein n=1 Tax=Sporobolomyces salmoneus TaxID=183962 RepID=UPI0031792C3F
MPSPKQYKRPKNPPRPSSLQPLHLSSDSTSSFRTAPSTPIGAPSTTSDDAVSPTSRGPTTPPPPPPVPTLNLQNSPRERSTPSPTSSNDSRSRASSFRKPVPTLESIVREETPSPKTITGAGGGGKPRLTNPNPFASSTSGANPQSISKSTSLDLGRRSPDDLSPTSAEQPKATSTRAPPVPSPSSSMFTEDLDEFPTLNFDRRPSQFDPIAPSFHHHSGGPLVHSSSNSTSSSSAGVPRSLIPIPTTTSSTSQHNRASSGGLHHRKTSSGHVRQPSISLSSTSSSGPSPLPSPRTLLPSHASHPGSRKILPLQPAAGNPKNGGSGGSGGTRAPLETFASIEMLQGQRQAMEKQRGTEVFGPSGYYEGRATSDLTLPPYTRHQENPLSNLHAARNPALAQQYPSILPGGGTGPAIPAFVHDSAAGASGLDMAGSIASQLREHDLRRGSEDVRGEWTRRFSESASSSDDPLSPTTTSDIGGNSLNPQFTFPRPGSTTSSFDQDNKHLLHSTFEDDDDRKSKMHALKHSKSKFLKTFGNKGNASTQAQDDSISKSVWATENLGPTSHPFSLAPRPSIVALPVYPPTSSSSPANSTDRIKKVGSKVAIVTALLSTAATGVYLALRYRQLLNVEKKIPNVFVGGWAFIILETIVAGMIAIHTIFTVLTYKPKGSTPKLRLRGDQNLPSVDVFVVSSGQADQTVFDCAVAAASMDYPAHRFRVMVLDPTCSASLSQSLSKHAATQACPHLSYHRRELLNGLAPVDSKDEKQKKKTLVLSSPKRTNGEMKKKDNFDNKANSINFGMQEASTFGMKGPADYIAVFDADMIPERNYLRAVLPSILRDDKVALVKTRNGFINLPHRLSQPVGTMMNAAETDADNRSGFLLRRNALTAIGGFPTDSWIHDGQAEALLLGRGYRVAQVEEVLQWGMAKPTYLAQVNAMSVNRLGPLRTAARLGWFLRGDKVKLMPWNARIKAIGRALLPIFSLLVVILAYIYPFMFSFGGILVLTPNLRELNKLLQATLVMLVLQRVHEFVWTYSTGLPSPRRSFQSWIFSAPYNAFAIVRLILPRQLGGYLRGTDLDINETIAVPERQVWWKRGLWFICDPHVGTMFAFVAALGVAVWRIARDYERGTVDPHQTALTVLLTVAWPSLLWLEFVFAAFVPFVCLLFPSRLLTEPRESFLIRDHYSSVARPKHHFKTAPPFKVYRALEFVVGVFIVAWAVVCVCVAELTDVLA